MILPSRVICRVMHHRVAEGANSPNSISAQDLERDRVGGWGHGAGSGGGVGLNSTLG